MVSRVFVRPARVRRPNGLEMPLAEAPPRAAGATFLEDLRAAPLLKPVADRGRPLGDAEFSEQELEIQPSGLWAHPRRTCWGSPRRPFRRGHLVRQSLCGGYVASAKLRSWGYQASPLRSLRERARDAAWHRAWECSAKERARSRRVCWPTCAVVCRFLLCRAVPAQPLQGRCEPWLQGGPPSGQFSEPLAVRSHRVRGAVAGAGVHDARTPTLVRSLQ
ncbi:unnamed protein product, partial [Prorocentrum cordatum]